MGLVKIAWCQGDFCQESLTKLQKLVDNRAVYKIFDKMGFGKLGTNLGGALALSAAVTAMPDKAEAGGFEDYCEPVANGEILETELTPYNMPYIFDDFGRVVGARADELTQYFGDGITEECGVGDVGAYVSQFGQMVLLEIYPPGQYPLGIAPETFETLQVDYEECIAEELTFVDENQNGRIDPEEDANLYLTGEAFCNEEFQAGVRHEGEMAAMRDRMAALDQDQAEAEARIAALDRNQAEAEERIAYYTAALQAQTEAIINGARQQVGLY